MFSDISLSAKGGQKVPDACPHCGNKLSPWQQVLLSTDRALICKKCWYRIILDVTAEPTPAKAVTGHKGEQSKG